MRYHCATRAGPGGRAQRGVERRGARTHQRVPGASTQPAPGSTLGPALGSTLGPALGSTLGGVPAATRVAARGCPREPPRSAEQLVVGVEVVDELLHLGHPAVADREDQGAVVGDRPAVALGTDAVDADGTHVVGEDATHVDGEGAAGQLHAAGEVPDDRVDALVVAGELAAPGNVPDDVRVEQLPEGVHVTTAEGVIAAPDEVLVGMAH